MLLILIVWILHNSMVVSYRNQTDDDLVEDGVYAYTRHPLYTGMLMATWSQPTMVRINNLSLICMLALTLNQLTYIHRPQLFRNLRDSPRFFHFVLDPRSYCCPGSMSIPTKL